MAFKSDRSFLDKVSMGATGTIHAKRILTEHDHDVIELERYSTCNKIWSTKVKRLRVPDLLCLRCGRRIEVRSKSTLKITMSDSPTVPDRRWDYGLRDEDLVLLILCRKDPHTSEWIPSDVINAFSIGDLRATVNLSRLGPPKSASEGAERDRTWPGYVPAFDGRIIEVRPEFITMLKANGRRQTYPLTRSGYYPHVTLGQAFEADSIIIASVVPQVAKLDCNAEVPYDFAADLTAPDRETLYCAVKALGRLPDAGRGAAPRLLRIARGGCDDGLVQLEAYASLARLGHTEGWAGIRRFLQSDNVEARMEAALILGELNTPAARTLLASIAADRGNDSELRAAAVWGLGQMRFDNPLTELVPYLADADRTVAVHAIVASLPHINTETLPLLLRGLGPRDRSAAMIRAIIESGCQDVGILVDYFFNHSTMEQQPWLMYLFGLLGEEVCRPVLEATGEEGSRVIDSLSLLWNQHNRDWTNRLNIQDLLDYTMHQNIRGT